jgi:hypothetical protein
VTVPTPAHDETLLRPTLRGKINATASRLDLHDANEGESRMRLADGLDQLTRDVARVDRRLRDIERRLNIKPGG